MLKKNCNRINVLYVCVFLFFFKKDYNLYAFLIENKYITLKI